MRRVLLSRVSARVYSMIRDQTDYQGAMDALKRQYRRPVNTVFSRHRLATWQQRAGESSAEWVRALQTLMRACNCRGLTAEQHTELLVRDAFVTEIRPVYLCQWLLEHADLTLHSAIELADTQEAALRNADAVQARHLPPAPWTLQTLQPAGESTSAAVSRKSAQCYFCGLEKHPQKRCLAQEATCSSCGKKGHFAKACKSKPRAGSSSAVCKAWGRPSWSLPSCLPTACEAWGRPSCLPAACEVWGRPSLSAPPRPASDPRELTGHQDGDSTLASVTLDQSAPHQLARSMMDILVEGHRTSCLFDMGSTESFIHPYTVQRCRLVTRPVSQRVTMASGLYSTDIWGGLRSDVGGAGHRISELLITGHASTVCACAIGASIPEPPEKCDNGV
ncbi:uncharacterized protein LOC132399583 [Hypanus sabinus]|uniref:uncharacterized protein LOC132399583 n=1 Tax=Hypanus sabinus TaxID=79690 RepID=UPI0028C4A49F|nr:uncharacterized protein LOC132399583 [Hypanus sabinus]XP_059836079.1 uncharacterized protein LOC132399583 [Hypanus sabinus]